MPLTVCFVSLEPTHKYQIQPRRRQKTKIHRCLLRAYLMYFRSGLWAYFDCYWNDEIIIYFSKNSIWNLILYSNLQQMLYICSGEVVCSMFEICTLCWLMNATCAILKHLISNSGFFFFLLFIINQIKSTENSWCCLARFIEFQELCKNFNIAKSFE